MSDILYTATMELFRIASENKGKCGYKYPVAAVLFDRNKEVIISSAVNIKPENEKDLGVKEKSPYHAEISVIKEMREKGIKNKNLSILITIPPCHPCYEAIEATGQIDEIIFISRRFQSFKWDSRNKTILKNNLNLIDFTKINKNIDAVSELLKKNKKYIRNIELICKFSGK